MAGAAITCIKLGVALVAALAALRLMKGRSRWASVTLGACALLAVCAYFRFGNVPGGYVHRWEMYHYYVGSKYHAELGYEGLYRCALIADAEDGVRMGSRRAIRDLETDGTISAERVLAAPEVCKSGFSAARWQDFRRDVRFFRRGLGRAWETAQLDHGYNPPPLWTALWGQLCQRVPATYRNLQALAGIDLLLMLGGLLAMLAAFGPRVALVATVFWGTQAASDVGWTGGGLVRQDWLCLCLVGVALLRRRQFGVAGAALALAGMLRLFPLVLLLGATGVWLGRWIREGRVPMGARRFALGAALAGTVGLGVSMASSGPADYARFWSHIQLRHEAIINNHMGLRTLIASAPVTVEVTKAASGEPSWVGERRQRLEQLGGVRAACLALAAVALLAALWQSRQAWVGAALSVVAIPLFMDPSNYYYSFCVVLVPLLLRRRALSVLWCVLAAGGQLLQLGYGLPEQRYAALSWLYVGISLLVVLAFVRLPRLGSGTERRLVCKATG